MSENLPAIQQGAQQPASQPTLQPTPQQFTREQQSEFIFALAAWGNVRAAAKAAGVSRSTAYRMRRGCARFDALWNAALVMARPRVEEVLADRALNGVEEQVFYHGEEVATRRRFSDRLLLAHLGRLDRLIKDEATGAVLADFDAALEALERAPELVMVADAGPAAGEA